MKIEYIKKRFTGRNLALIERINQVIALYKKQEKRTTIKSIHKKLVEWKDIGDTKRDYKRLVQVISNARQAGLIDWDAIDGRRQLQKGEE